MKSGWMLCGWMLSGWIEQTKSWLPAVVVNSASLRLAGRAKAPVATSAVVALGLLFVVGCNEGKPDPKAEAPPTASVQPDMDANNFKVDHPELVSVGNGGGVQGGAGAQCYGRGAARYRPRRTGDFAGRGTSGGSESEAGRCGEKRPIAAARCRAMMFPAPTRVTAKP